VSAFDRTRPSGFDRTQNSAFENYTTPLRKKVGGREIPGHTVGMKKKTQRPPTPSKLPVLRQLCHLIPPHLVAQLARDLGADKLARSFSHWSHVVALLYAQLVHAISLNDVCDSLRLHSGPLSGLRGATPSC
jgi:Domain of unknown function (DUF4372)